MQRSGYWLAAGAATLALCIGSGGKALLAEETPPTALHTAPADSPDERFYAEKLAKIDSADPTPRLSIPDYGTASRYKMTAVRSWVAHEVIRHQKQGQSGWMQSGPVSHP